MCPETHRSPQETLRHRRGISGAVTMSAMLSARTKLRQMPPWALVWLSSVLLLGILSMHSAIVSDGGGLIDHHGSISGVESSVSSVISVGDLNNESGLSISDCGGIAMLCLTMIAGASAYIVLRGRAADQVFWQVAPTIKMAFARPSGPFETRNPRERSSVLRR